MSQPVYDSKSTALLLVDPYNDFLSEGGKIWPRIKTIAEEVGLIANLKAIDQAIRLAGIRVIIAPHRRWELGDYEDWSHPNPTQINIMNRHSFARAANGGATGIRTSLPNPATLSPRNTGDRAALPTLILTSRCANGASRM